MSLEFTFEAPGISKKELLEALAETEEEYLARGARIPCRGIELRFSLRPGLAEPGDPVKIAGVPFQVASKEEGSLFLEPAAEILENLDEVTAELRAGLAAESD